MTDQTVEQKQLTLGQLIDLLAACNQTKPIRLDTGDVPGELQSWRGIYAELAMTYEREGIGTPRQVREILRDALNAEGSRFTGYKGGEFRMSRSAPIWLANYGESRYRDGDCRILTGVRDDANCVVLKTAASDVYGL